MCRNALSRELRENLGGVCPCPAFCHYILWLTDPPTQPDVFGSRRSTEILRCFRKNSIDRTCPQDRARTAGDSSHRSRSSRAPGRSEKVLIARYFRMRSTQFRALGARIEATVHTTSGVQTQHSHQMQKRHGQPPPRATTGRESRYEEMVGAARFELTTPCTQNRCATRLRHAPDHGRPCRPLCVI